MGQIVSLAAKPKRCNANQLSQVPTPAAGEHILVSSDNSMNAAGQGNFDCYIEGDGQKAATALELKPILKELYVSTGESSWRDLDLTSYTTNNKYITSNNVWSASTKNTSINIPVVAGTEIHIKSNNTNGAIIAFLKTDTNVGTAIDFSVSYNARISLSAGSEVDYTIPSDCTLLYVFQKTEYDNFLPSKISVLDNDTKVLITDKLSEEVEELNGEVDGVSKQIYGGNANIPITLKQGYATRGSATSVTINNSLSTRVMSCVLKGAYNVKTNNGYVIRGITAWNGGSATEGELPTSNIVDVTNCVNLLEGSSATEYSCDGFYDYSIITFCKSNASSSISPSEDIVESCVEEITGLISRVTLLEASVGTYKVVNKVLFMGDSINYGLASYFNDTKSGVRVVTTNRISDYFAQMTGAQVDNIAARGTGYVADTRSLGNGWVKAQNTDFSAYDLVCICLGINDYIQHVNIGTLEANAEGTVIGNMTRIINKIMTDNPLCKVVIFSPYNSWGQVCDDSGSEYQSNVLYGDESTDYALGYAISGHTLTDYIAAIDSVCTAYHIQHIKLSASGMINKANIKKVLADGLHPIVDVRPMLAAELFGRKMYD